LPTTVRAGRCRVNGAAIRKGRESKGWTATDLGYLLGVVERTVYRFEAEQTMPTLEQGLKLQGLLDLDDEVLFKPLDLSAEGDRTTLDPV
jgi:predicted transcriptional regulator